MSMTEPVLTLDAVPFEAFCAKRGMKVPPTALVTGLSGAGKTRVCEWMAQAGFLHLAGC